METTQRSSLQRGYSLSALFLLIALCAVLLGLVALALRLGQADNERVWAMLGASVGGAFVLMVAGGLLGLSCYFRVRSVFAGMIVGGIVGLAFGPVLFIPPSHFSLLLAWSVGGAVLLLGLGTAFRLTAGQPVSPAAGPPPPAASPPRKRHPLDPDPDEDGQCPFALPTVANGGRQPPGG